jgi:hypothetical protein
VPEKSPALNKSVLLSDRHLHVQVSPLQSLIVAFIKYLLYLKHHLGLSVYSQLICNQTIYSLQLRDSMLPSVKWDSKASLL